MDPAIEPIKNGKGEWEVRRGQEGPEECRKRRVGGRGRRNKPSEAQNPEWNQVLKGTELSCTFSSLADG